MFFNIFLSFPQLLMEFSLDLASPWLKIPRAPSKSSMTTGKLLNTIKFIKTYVFCLPKVAPLTTAFSLGSHLMATHSNRSMKLFVSLKATVSSSNVTSSTVWALANQPSVNGAVTQWNHGAESVVPSEMRRMKVMMKWTYRKKFSFSISEMKTTVISWEAATQAQISVKVIFVYRKILLTQIKLQRHSLQTKQLQSSSPAPRKPPFWLWLLLALSWCLSICAHCSATTRKNGCNHQKWCLRSLAPHRDSNF